MAESPTPQSRTGRARIGAWWPALLAWVAAVEAISTVCVMNGISPVSGGPWARWDSSIYESIATDGYNLARCRPPYGPPTDWCGNTGWFPGYPWLVGGLHHAGISIGAAAPLVAWAFSLGTLVLLWNTFLERRLAAASAGALLYAAFAPGQIYHFAVFPLSMLAFWTVAHLWLLVRGRWLAAGLCGAIAAIAYPLGVLLAPVSALWLLLRGAETPLSERLRPIAIASGLTLAGFAFVLVDQAIETGHWDGYFVVQSHFGHHFQEPAGALWRSIRPLFHAPLLDLGKSAPAAQSLLVLLVLAAVLAVVARRGRGADRVDLLIALWAFATWLFPLTQANVALYRSQAALLPLALLVRRLPLPVLFAVVSAAAALSLPIVQLFLLYKLV